MLFRSDNEVLSSKETEWDVTNPDPQYHYDMILAAMKETASALPKIEAIGGSATGTVSGANEATWCDIFPNVPPDVYREKVVDIFVRLAKEMAGDVPLKVINDGEVTALAAVQKIGKGNVMGISMGSSEGGGYANADGNLLGWINELCYIRLDMFPEAPTDPWTKGSHTGMSHMYLGQRGATKLAAKAGVDLPENMVYPHPDMCTIKHENHAKVLKLIQKAMEDPAKEPKVKELYVTMGVYLGYALAQYSEFYQIDHVMILGRVSRGAGGDMMLDTAKQVLESEFPEYKIEFHTADDHFKGVGQCIAAAALAPSPSVRVSAAVRRIRGVGGVGHAPVVGHVTVVATERSRVHTIAHAPIRRPSHVRSLTIASQPPEPPLPRTIIPNLAALSTTISLARHLRATVIHTGGTCSAGGRCCCHARPQQRPQLARRG